VTLLLARFLEVMFVFVPLERLFPFHAGQTVLRPGWKTDALYYLANGVLFLVLLKIWQRLIPDGLAWLHPFSLDLSLARQPLVVQIVAVLAVGSFVYYWAHRALHAWRPLWRFHAVHHSIEQLDWLATYRGHVFETIYFTSLTSIAMAFLSVPTPVALGFTIYRFFEGQIEHSNVRVPLGPLKWVVPSPWFHHWHHSLDHEVQNRNFSPYPVWDVVFGTAYMPAGRIPDTFGVDEPMPRDYLGQFAFPFGLSEAAERIQDRYGAAWGRLLGRASVLIGRRKQGDS